MNKTKLLKILDATAGSLLCRILGHLNYVDDSTIPKRSINKKDIRKILVIRPGGIGDMIILMPILERLSKDIPEASLDILCEKRNAEVLKIYDFKARPLLYDNSPFSLPHILACGKYDVVIDAEQFHHFSAIFAHLTKAPVRIGFKINPKRNPLYTHLVSYNPDANEGSQFSRLLEPLGIEMDFKLHGTLKIAHSSTRLPDKTADFLKSRKYAVIHPGGSTLYKKWNSSNYSLLIKDLSPDFPINFVMAGDSNDKTVANEIVSSTENTRVLSTAGQLDLFQTAETLSKASIFIGPDSGLLHLAVALGIPTVALFGPSDHLKWGFEDELHKIVRSDLPCAPCFIFGYSKPCRAIQCMKNISVDEVSARAREILMKNN